MGTLFLAGVMSNARVIEQRLADGTMGMEVVILGRSYRLGEDGSLTDAPPRVAG